MSYYDYSYGIPEDMLEMIEIMGAVFLGVFAVIGVFGLVMYILRSMALHTIAKRRGLKNAWLAWIPVGQEWIIGSVSDQYQYLTKGKLQNRRKILLGLQLAAVLIGSVFSVINLAGSLIGILNNYGYAWEYSGMMMTGLGVVGLNFLSSGLRIAAFVFRQMSMYDLYKSCNPKNCVVFLVLGIFFAVTEPFFLMSCRYRDDGMPPRKRDYEEPAFTDEEKPFDMT